MRPTPRHQHLPAHATPQNRGWNKGVPERAEEVLRVRMHEGVRHDLAFEQPELRLAGQRAIYEQVRRFEVGRVQGELLDRVAAIAQDAGVAIDIRDLALYDGSVKEALVGHAETLRRLVLYTFTRFERCGNRLEGRRRYGVVLYPSLVSASLLSLWKGAGRNVRNSICLPSAVVANGKTFIVDEFRIGVISSLPDLV